MTENIATTKPVHDVLRAAVEACEMGINRFTRFKADAMTHIDVAIAADNKYVLAKLVKAWMLLGGRDAIYREAVDGLIADIEQCFAGQVSAGKRERGLLEALKLSHAGQGIEAVTVLETLLDQAPCDLLVHQIIHEELFWLGRADWMRAITERASPAWDKDSADYGPFLSLRAFASEEAGDLDAAERFGRTAVEIDPTDIWGTHAVAHVHISRVGSSA